MKDQELLRRTITRDEELRAFAQHWLNRHRVAQMFQRAEAKRTVEGRPPIRFVADETWRVLTDPSSSTQTVIRARTDISSGLARLDDGSPGFLVYVATGETTGLNKLLELAKAIIDAVLVVSPSARAERVAALRTRKVIGDPVAKSLLRALYGSKAVASTPAQVVRRLAKRLEQERRAYIAHRKAILKRVS